MPSLHSLCCHAPRTSLLRYTQQPIYIKLRSRIKEKEIPRGVGLKPRTVRISASQFARGSGTSAAAAPAHGAVVYVPTTARAAQHDNGRTVLLGKPEPALYPTGVTSPSFSMASVGRSWADRNVCRDISKGKSSTAPSPREATVLKQNIQKDSRSAGCCCIRLRKFVPL
jgi:hypothetical protein